MKECSQVMLRVDFCCLFILIMPRLPCKHSSLQDLFVTLTQLSTPFLRRWGDSNPSEGRHT